jgi:hypothetical protein
MINGRMAEWLTSAIMIVFALTLMLPGDLVADSATFAFFARLHITELILASSMGVVAGMRMIALYINGSWRRTPWIRMAGAILGAGMFGFLSVSFFWPFCFGLVPDLSPQSGIYAVLATFDIIAAYRSGFDAKLVRP